MVAVLTVKGFFCMIRARLYEGIKKCLSGEEQSMCYSDFEDVLGKVSIEWNIREWSSYIEYLG